MHGLAKRYGDLHAVTGIDLAVHPGETFGILGPNGAGKTTTLEMIEGLTRPDAGTVEILGEPVWPDPRSVQRRIGVQLQHTALFDNLDAGELLALFCDLYGVPRDPARIAGCSRRSAWSRSRARSPRSSRAASSSAWRSPWPSCTSPRSCSSTSRPRASTRRRAGTCGT